VLKWFVDLENPVSGITNPRTDDEVDATSEDDGDAGPVMMAGSLLPSQASRLRCTPRQEQSRETSASRGRSIGLQQNRKRPREEVHLADLVTTLDKDRALRREELRRRLEQDQEEREQRERERQKYREERERERENLREEREHQRVIQHETHKMNLEMFKRIAEMMAKANARQRGVQ